MLVGTSNGQFEACRALRVPKALMRRRQRWFCRSMSCNHPELNWTNGMQVPLWFDDSG